MAQNPQTLLTVTLSDYGYEKGSFQIHVPAIGSGNVAAYTASPITGIVGDVVDAIADITDGNKVTQQISFIRRVSNLPATSPSSQRERKWVVSYEDTTTHRLYSVEIPCAKIVAGYLKTNTEEVDFDAVNGHADMLAFKSAFEGGGVLSPDGNSVAIVKMWHTGART